MIIFQFSDIGVGNPERHGQGLKDSYISYRVTSNLEEEQFNVSRRYNDFCELQQILTNNLPSIILPPLPEKQSLTQLIGGDRFNPEIIRRRQTGLSRWLNRINCHERITRCTAYREFMCNATVPNYEILNLSEDQVSSSVEGGDSNVVINEDEFTNAKNEIDLLNKHLKELNRQTDKWNKHQRGKLDPV